MNRSTIFMLTCSTVIALCQPALAIEKTLICDNGLRPDQVPHITMDLDEANSTVTVNYPATSIYYDSLLKDTPARSVGPVAAAFDPKSIVFDLRDQEPGFYKHFTLDRLTGVLLDYNSVDAPYDKAPATDKGVWSYNCQLGTAKF
jgi:hypothetical protein